MNALANRPALFAALLLLITALMLHSSWNAPFYPVDDQDDVCPIAQQEWSYFLRIKHGVIFPITFLSHKFDHALFAQPGVDPVNDIRWATGSRLMNGLLHCLCAILLFAFLQRIGLEKILAALVAIVWTAHPTACETVCWISERRSLVAAVFCLGALLAWTYRERWWCLLVAYACYSLALFSKGSALGVLTLFAGLELLRPGGTFDWRNWKEWLHSAARLAPLLVPVYFGIRFATGMYSFAFVDPPGGTVWTALLSDFDIFGRYLLHVFVPVNLSFYYDVEPIVSLADSRLWLYAGGMIAFLGALVWLPLPADRKLAFFGVYWFFGTLGQNANIVATEYPMQDRFIYIPMAGVMLAAVLAVKGAVERFKISAFLLRTGAAVYIAAIIALMFFRSDLYRDTELLELEAAQLQPGSARARMSAARIFRRKAIEQFTRTPQDPRLLADFVKAALAEYDAAERCRDIRNFSNIFDLNVFRAELLLMVSELARAQEVLKEWLPPKNLPLLPDKIQYSTRELYHGYRAQALSYAYKLSGEISQRQALAPGLSNEQRIAFCREAVRSADEALKFDWQNHNAAMVKARALLLLSNLQSSDAEAARSARDAAIKALESIPPESPDAAAAKAMLQAIPQ